MSYMTSWEIGTAARWWRSHPVLGPATATLAALCDVSGRFPEGWLYSGGPARAGSALAALIRGDDAACCDRPDATPEKLRAALQPVIEFRAAHGPGFPVTSAPPGAADATPRVSGCHQMAPAMAALACPHTPVRRTATSPAACLPGRIIPEPIGPGR